MPPGGEEGFDGAAVEVANDEKLEDVADEGGGEERGGQGEEIIPVVGFLGDDSALDEAAGHELHFVGGVGADHHQLAVGHVDDAHEAEGDGEAEGHEDENGAEGDALEEVLEETDGGGVALDASDGGGEGGLDGGVFGVGGIRECFECGEGSEALDLAHLLDEPGRGFIGDAVIRIVELEQQGALAGDVADLGVGVVGGHFLEGRDGLDEVVGIAAALGAAETGVGVGGREAEQVLGLADEDALGAGGVDLVGLAAGDEDGFAAGVEQGLAGAGVEQGNKAVEVLVPRRGRRR